MSPPYGLLRAFGAGLLVGLLLGSSRLFSAEQVVPQRLAPAAGYTPSPLSREAGRSLPMPRYSARMAEQQLHSAAVGEAKKPPLPSQGEKAGGEREVKGEEEGEVGEGGGERRKEGGEERSTQGEKSEHSSSGGRGKAGGMWSRGLLKPLGAPVDVEAPGMADQLVARRSHKQEMIIFESDAQMKGWAYHWVNQMRQMGYEHWTILTDSNATCQALHAGWAPMVQRYDEEDLSCVWSSFPASHPGWKQWEPRTGKDMHHLVYQLWCTRWWVALQLLRRGVSVLSLDVDAVLLRDVYPLLHSPPLLYQHVIITQNSDNSQSLNCGFVYFNLRAEDGDRREVNEACGVEQLGGVGERGGEGVPVALWVAELMWERIRLFLEIDKSALSQPPQREVLWEQDIWNDLAKSIELRRRVFPWAVGYGHHSDLWPQLGYERKVSGGALHKEKWVSWRQMVSKMPPWSPPDEMNAHAFFETNLRRPLRWVPACGPVNASSGAQAPTASTSRGIELGLLTPAPPRSGRMAIAPSWLSSLGDDPESDWAGSDPTGFAYLHLTNMWHCFPHMCWSKAGRLFWLRVHGFWDRRLDDLAITPRGSPFESNTRVLTLPSGAYKALEAITPEEVNGERASSRVRGLAFRRMHALVHNLVVVAGLLDRKPVLPAVPCSLIAAVQPTGGVPVRRSRFGISHPSVVATGTARQPICNLSPGTWRPGGPDQCYHSRVMHSFDFDKFVQLPAVKHSAVGSVLVDPPAEQSGAALGNESEWARDAWQQLIRICKSGVDQAEMSVIELQGLLPLRDYLLDRPLSSAEFDSENERKASGKPRWRSLLQKRQLRQLTAACPGAAKFIDLRLSCVGYFIAE